ncbi:MAG TPA: UDP-N-acetylglucosamine 1-carboxyvinyltransferase [Bacteroidales bacterium]|nr:UDP-N-acetylglucosamine 1-carboxyvinyltransferase [Bacteroidales bacterium]HPT02868.1 UDP-N-acetylglucosamine 1-carboxyvinyltransferase [Bacteroidales bacterium]
MGSFKIEGGSRLHGEIVPQGAKNEALQIISAVLLTPEEVTVRNIPDIHDVNKLIELIQLLGAKTERIDRNTCRFRADNVSPDNMMTDEFRHKAASLRGSVMILGPMLARFGKGYIPQPGGDKIGRRRLDTHMIGFLKLGASMDSDPAHNVTCLSAKKLHGTYMLLDEASVTGTANLVMAAVMAEGTTTIFNAACEPYLVQLCSMLVRMGARISGIGSNLLTIEGVKYLKGTEHTMLPDMIEIGSFIGLAAMTHSDVTIRNVNYQALGIIPDIFRKLGVKIFTEGDNIHVPAQEHYEVETFMDGSIMTISDAPWPGFTPDLISVVLVTAIQAKGSVLIHQKMFESRLFFVDKLIDMGAQIILCDPHRATVIGLDRKFPLRGIRMSSPDIRAGVSLLIAALSAKGTSIIDNIEQIDRGYENIDGRLRSLGARIQRIEQA